MLACAGSQLLEYRQDFAYPSPSGERRRASEVAAGDVVGSGEAITSEAGTDRIPDRLAMGSSPCSVAVIEAVATKAATWT